MFLIYVQSMDVKLSFLTTKLILDFFGPEMKVHSSSETPEFNEINKKATRDIELTSKQDQNHLTNRLLCTLSRHFEQNIPILAILGPKLKSTDFSQVPGCTEINEKATSDVQSTNKVYKNWAGNEGSQIYLGTRMHWN